MEYSEIKKDLISAYNIIILGIAYLFLGLTSSYIINTISPSYTTSDKITLCVEIAIEIGITILFSYYIHKIIENLPLPMIGTKEEKRQIIENERGGIIIAFAMFCLQVKLRTKIQYLFFGKLMEYQSVSIDT